MHVSCFSSVEMDLLHHILQAQRDLSDWKFLPSLLHLHESKVKLFSWNKVLPASSVKDVSCVSLAQDHDLVVVVVTMSRWLM